MGPRRISTTSNASGSWLLDEQCDAQRAGIWPIGPQFDPYWENVSLLLHMDGSNGSTTFTDSGPSARSVTRTGNVQISTTQSKFGGASGYFDGTSDCLTVTDSNAFSFGADLFTIEFWFYVPPATTDRTLFVMPRIGGGWPTLIVFLTGSGNVGAYCSTTGGSFAHYMNTASIGAVVANTWNHFAYVRTGAGGNDYRVFLNGTINSPGDANYPSTVSTYPSVNEIRISDAFNSTFGVDSWLGYIDELRITKGIARYTSNFTPPTAAFPTPPAAPNPIPALSPVLWYDFADEATVTTSGTAITAVTDKGSNGWTLSVGGTSPQYVTGINGKKCLDWGASPAHGNFLYNANNTTITIGEVYVVVDAAFGGTAGNYAGLLTAHNGGWYVLAYASLIATDGTGFDQLFINGGTSNKFSGDLFGSPSIDDPAIMQINSSIGNTIFSGGGIQIGNDRIFSNLNRGWSGLIGEYVIFPSVLSPTDRDAVQAWLATKWGITLEGQGNG